MHACVRVCVVYSTVYRTHPRKQHIIGRAFRRCGRERKTHKLWESVARAALRLCALYCSNIVPHKSDTYAGQNVVIAEWRIHSQIYTFYGIWCITVLHVHPVNLEWAEIYAECVPIRSSYTHTICAHVSRTLTRTQDTYITEARSSTSPTAAAAAAAASPAAAAASTAMEITCARTWHFAGSSAAPANTQSGAENTHNEILALQRSPNANNSRRIFNIANARVRGALELYYA